MADTKRVKHLNNLTEDGVYELFEQFLDDVEESDYKVYPSRSRFAKWLGVSRKEVMEWTAQHPYATKKLSDMTSDTLVEGMLLKKYVTSGALSTLKNICGWQDNPKPTKAQNGKVTATEKQAEKSIEKYIQEKRAESSLRDTIS